jgi:NTP pyrophosphatase (non-canonical NTP hydrolase)
MNKAAVGFRVHSGWSAMVVVSLEKSEPVVLRRMRLRLVKTFSYAYRQPYHTAEKMELAEAGEFVAAVLAEAEELAYRALHAMRMELQKLGWKLERGALLLASGRELPEFEKILASHALIHTADGELFRAAIRAACGRSGLRVTEIRERELVESCAEKFAMREPAVLRRATELGREFGAPWTQDEKFATLGAWLTAEIR